MQYSFRKTLRTNEGKAYLLVWLTWGSPLLSLLIGVFLRISLLAPFAYSVVPSINIIVALLASSYLVKVYRIKDFVLYLICVLIYLIQYAFFPFNIEVLDNYAMSFLFSSLPLYFIGLIIRLDKYEKVLYTISILCLIWAFFYSFLYKQAGGTEERDYASMFWAYLYLPHVLFVIYMTVKEFNLIKLFLSIAGSFLILSYGSRGPVLCILLFIPGMLFIFNKIKRPFITWITIGLVLFLFYLYFEQIVLALQSLIGELGMRTRVVDKLLDEELSDSSGRSEYIPILMPRILEGGFWGYGICGSWRFIGSYPHNLLLDFWVSFGLFPGSILFLAIIVIVIKGFKGCSSKEETAFLYLLLIRGFVMLFLSYNFLENGHLYMLLGYCIYLIRRRKTYSINVIRRNKNISYALIQQ